MEDKGREAFPGQYSVPSVNDAPAPGYGSDQQLPPQGGGYPSRPYPTPQAAQPPQGYGAPVAMPPMMPSMQPFGVSRQYRKPLQIPLFLSNRCNRDSKKILTISKWSI